MRPNGPSQTAQRLGVACRAFRKGLGISASSDLHSHPNLSFAVAGQGTWITFEPRRNRWRFASLNRLPNSK